MNYPYTLEKYKGPGTRHTCPSCFHEKEFSRYVDVETGEYLDDKVGKCNRENNCGYHYKPREFFATNPGFKVKRNLTNLNKNKRFDFIREDNKFTAIPKELLKETLVNNNKNNFIRFLKSRFEAAVVNQIIQKYFIGTWRDGRTVFWQVDEKGFIRTGKLMTYDAITGKRIKAINPSWVHSEIKRIFGFKSSPFEKGEKEFFLQQCFFGEHQLIVEKKKSIAIAESEKTAIVASLFIPQFLWMATGGSGNLNIKRLSEIGKGRIIYLYPDSSKYDVWSAKAKTARKEFNIQIIVSDVLERRLTDAQKLEDYDIADILLKEFPFNQ